MHLPLFLRQPGYQARGLTRGFASPPCDGFALIGKRVLKITSCYAGLCLPRHRRTVDSRDTKCKPLINDLAFVSVQGRAFTCCCDARSAGNAHACQPDTLNFPFRPGRFQPLSGCQKQRRRGLSDPRNSACCLVRGQGMQNARPPQPPSRAATAQGISRTRNPSP